MTGLLRETLELGFYDRRRRRTKELRGRSPAGGAVDRFKIGDPSRHACFARNAPEPPRQGFALLRVRRVRSFVGSSISNAKPACESVPLRAP
jgi:hypothetical protein